MYCIEAGSTRARAWRLGALSALVAALSGCAYFRKEPAPAPAPAPAAAPLAAAPQATARRAAPAPVAAAPLPPARSWDEYRLRAARRLVSANPDTTYMGEVPEPLLAIPIIEADLNADGSIARITVIRKPSQAPETVQMAIDAMRRAAPFGDVSRLSKPWKFREIFLFDDDHRFKPRTLDN